VQFRHRGELGENCIAAQRAGTRLRSAHRFI